MTPPTDFQQTYARYLPPIRAKCRRLLGRGPAADDVAQETFERLWRAGALDSSDPRATMSWLYRTCTRLAIDELRRRRSDGAEGGIDDLPCRMDPGACAEARATIRSLARNVSEEELAAVVLCRVDGLPQPEAATVLGVSERTVRRMLERFDEQTRTLKKELSP